MRCEERQTTGGDCTPPGKPPESDHRLQHGADRQGVGQSDRRLDLAQLFDLGEARGRVDAAAAILERIISNQERYADQVSTGTCDYTVESRLRVMLLANEVARLCHEAIELLYAKCGTSGVQKGQLMERVFRDMATIRTHYIMDAQRHAQNWGAEFLGEGEQTPY